jgi:cysteinyl-tRNA synthetase
MDQAAETVRGLDAVDRASAGIAAAEPEAEVLARFREFMDDDLNTPRATALIFDLVRRANAEDDLAAAAAAVELTGALGLELRVEEDAVDDATLAKMAERDAARSAKDWARADALRAELQEMGWTVEDTAEGTKVRRG